MTYEDLQERENRDGDLRLPDVPAESVLHAAISYEMRGWSVIPIRSEDKRPLVPWRRYQEARATQAEIAEWFRRGRANVGIVTGAVSGLVVVDIDPDKGGLESFAAWEKEHGSLVPSAEVQTGGGGRHLYFAHPGQTVNNRAGLAAGIDFRGDAGYIVAPPSIHRSGKPYIWLNPAEELAEMPSWLLRRVTSRAPRDPKHWRELVAGSVREGVRNDSIASLTGHLLHRGVDPEVARELLLCWNRFRCNPPLPDAEVLRTVESISRIHARNRS